MKNLARKFRQLASDPVLRRWLAGRLVGIWPGEPTFQAHNPPYLDGLLPLEAEQPTASFGECDRERPGGSIQLPLPGEVLNLDPGGVEGVFKRQFDDTETLLALHRFAWLPLLGDKLDARWVAALWHAWLKDCATPSEQWSWHPYTAAERVVNILHFARRHGLPGTTDETLAALASHGPAIARRLEYFGAHHTSNHLSNNGRGLFILGLALSLDKCAELGAKILIEEARRIFHPASGMLREGSSHYHLLLTRNYAEAWLAAKRHDRPEAEILEQILGRALSAASSLLLPGGFPAIGDISPDCPPDFLFGLIPGGGETGGWRGLLDGAEDREIKNLLDKSEPVDSRNLRADGWLRADFAPWSGLWHAAPDGWSAMPGHGHQDLGGFEIHYADEALFVDPGRGTYGGPGGGMAEISGGIHNTLLVDGRDPYPPNKPYYSEDFRRRVVSGPPVLDADGSEVTLSHQGFARLGGCGAVRRAWRFAADGFSLTDRVEGRGPHRIRRLLLTALPVEAVTGGAVVRGRSGEFLIETEGAVRLEPVMIWRTYGRGRPGTRIAIETEASLPWKGVLTVRRR